MAGGSSRRRRYSEGMGKPIVLTILDGWGYRAETHGNAIAQARKPMYDRLLREYPNTLLRASEHFVGLPDGQMGNSEVGHLNLGAGRIVRMDMTRIDTAIADGVVLSRPDAGAGDGAGAGQKGRALHLIGLLSDGGVHSHQRHLYALLRMAKAAGARAGVCACVHGWAGYDADLAGWGIWRSWSGSFGRLGWGGWRRCSGRYFAMDRDLRWEKERQAFDAMVTGQAEGGVYADALARIKELYSNGVTDEFTPPFTVRRGRG